MSNIAQIKSIPFHLPTLVNMLIVRPVVSNRQFLQPALIIAQLIQTIFRKNKNHGIQQIPKVPIQWGYPKERNLVPVHIFVFLLGCILKNLC